MKKGFQLALISISLVCLSFLSLHSQTPTKGQRGSYKVWVTKMDKSSKAKGYITQIGDSSMIVTNLFTSDSKIINVNVMDEIKFKRKGSFGRGILYGALAGLTTGAIIGFASGDDSNCFLLCFSAEAKALFLGSALALPGAVIDGIIGHNMRIKIPIKGSQKAYDRQKEKLKKYKLSF